MKKIFILALISFFSLLPTVSIACSHKGMVMRMDNSLDNLGLSDEQKTKIENIENLKISEEEKEKAILQVLTKEQWAKRAAKRITKQKLF